MCDFFKTIVNKEFWEQVDALAAFFKDADPPSDYDWQAPFLGNTTVDFNKNQR